MIVVGLGGGLGNRLAALYSTYNIKFKYKIKIKYFWFQDYNCNCKYGDLFSKYKLEISNLDIKKFIQKKDSVLRKEEIHQDIFWDTPMYATMDGESSLGRFFFNSFNKITINENVLSRINSVCLSNPRLNLIDLIGIHVRGGDLKKDLIEKRDKRKYAPPEVFFVEVEKILKKNKHQKFFLSCENAEDEDKFLSKYNKNIIKLENSTKNRNTKEGIVDAFANMVLLSKCSRIIGTKSSFSDVASYISGINKTNIEDNFKLH